jgi:hypothetical protein
MNKLLLMLVFFLSIALLSSAQSEPTKPNPNNDAKCVSGNCVNGIGTMAFIHTDGPATYKGSFKNGQFNGQGTLVVKDNYKYTGSFKEGFMDGKGIMTFTDGGIYTGEMQKGLRQGTGTFVFKDGKRSTGTWKENRLWIGTGFLIFDSKDSYYGSVRENQMDGQGVYTYVNGKKLTGIFSKSKIVSGNGYFYLPADSASYEGSLSNGQINGKGTMTWLATGKKITGIFTDGSVSGNGVAIYPEGSKYEGNFKNNIRNGYGIFTYKNGEVYKGEYLMGNKNGEGSYYDAKGNLDYKGEWVNGAMKYPEKAASYKNNLWEAAQKAFSRVTFKGWQEVVLNDQKGSVDITDEYHLNSDYTFYGTNEFIISYQGKNYRTKQKTVGSFDPVTWKIHISTREFLHEEPIEGITWIRGAADGTVYENSSKPGHYIIRGKDISGNDFEETDD